MTPRQNRPKDEDMVKATAALIRAAKRARKLAQQTGTSIVVVRKGKLVKEVPAADSEGAQSA